MRKGKKDEFVGHNLLCLKQEGALKGSYHASMRFEIAGSVRTIHDLCNNDVDSNLKHKKKEGWTG